MAELYQSLSHSKWDCKYHVVFVPKRRRKAIFGQARRQLGAIFHALSGVNYFFGLTTTISPDQRRLLFDA